MYFLGKKILERICENVHPRSLIEKLKSETNGEGDHVFLNKIIVNTITILEEKYFNSSIVVGPGVN